jgi:hypothetical protein
LCQYITRRAHAFCEAITLAKSGLSTERFAITASQALSCASRIDLGVR